MGCIKCIKGDGLKYDSILSYHYVYMNFYTMKTIYGGDNILMFTDIIHCKVVIYLSQPHEEFFIYLGNLLAFVEFKSLPINGQNSSIMMWLIRRGKIQVLWG